MSAIDVSARPRSVSRIGPTGIVIVVSVFALAFVIGYMAYQRFAAPQAAAAPAGQPVQVRRGNVAATVSTTGNVVATRTSKLTMQVGGRLKELPIKLGDRVAAGALIAKVDTTTLEIKLEESRGSLRTAQLRLEQLRAGARPEDVTAAEASVSSAQARLTDVQAGATQQDLNQAQALIESAGANVRSAQARLEQVRAGPTADTVAAAEQSVTSAKTNLEKAQIALETLKAGATAADIRQAELAIEQARNSLWSQQLNRDSTCGRQHGPPCTSAHAAVAAAESSVTAANEKLKALKLLPTASDIALKQADVDAASESVRVTQVKLDQVKSGATSEDIRQAQASLESAQANYNSALEKMAALKAGAKPGDLEAARASVVQAQQQLALRKSPTTIQEIQLAEVAVRQAELAVKSVQNDLENATLRAPFAGLVGTVGANIGEQVSTNTPILTLVDPTQVRVDVTVDETDIAKIAPGMNAQVAFDALPEKRTTGKVLGISPNAAVQQGVANYQVSVSIDSVDGSIPVGMTANVGIVTQQKSDVLLVPNRAIRRVGRNQTVDVLVPGRPTPEARTVTTGLGNEQMTEIVDGVAEGDTILIASTTTQQPRVGGPGGFGGAPFAVKK